MSDHNQNNQEEGFEEVATTTNTMEGIDILEALAAEVETRAALDVGIVEYEAVGAIMIEGDAEILTIESSLEWGGNLIKE